jgi:hypothetical protein
LHSTFSFCHFLPQALISAKTKRSQPEAGTSSSTYEYCLLLFLATVLAALTGLVRLLLLARLLPATVLTTLAGLLRLVLLAGLLPAALLAALVLAHERNPLFGFAFATPTWGNV